VVEAMSKFNERIPTRQSLLSRLKHWDDEVSWKLFFDTYWRLIYRTALRAGLSESEAQDVVQETVISVCKNMPGFEYRNSGGSFKAWLMQLTKWRIKDQLRLRQSAPDGRSSSSQIPEEEVEEAVGEVEDTHNSGPAAWEEDWERNFMDVAIERVKLKVDSKLYQVFDLYVFKEWPVMKIAKAFGMKPGYIYTAKSRISNLLKQEVDQLREEANCQAAKLAAFTKKQ
jgi:RNA polymerase sigma factor (sigma-70 family)